MKISFLAFAAASSLGHASASSIRGGNQTTTHDSIVAEVQAVIKGGPVDTASRHERDLESGTRPPTKPPTGSTRPPTRPPSPSPTTRPTAPPTSRGDFLQIGDWKLARTCETCDRSTFSISSQAHGYTSQIFRDDGTYHAGPRTDFNGFDHSEGDGLTYSAQPIVFGDKAVQIRDWRIRQVDSTHLSVTNENGNVSRIYRSDGTVHGNVKGFGGYVIEDLGEPTCAYLTSLFLQLGDWRFGEMGGHLVVTHKYGKTAMIYRHDGTIHPGPRTDYNAWTLVDDEVLAGSSVCEPEESESCWDDGILCADGTTCNLCCNQFEYWYRKAFTACGSESCWDDGSVCAEGTTCNACCNGASHWYSKGFTACGSESCWPRGTYCWDCSRCCNGSTFTYCN